MCHMPPPPTAPPATELPAELAGTATVDGPLPEAAAAAAAAAAARVASTGDMAPAPCPTKACWEEEAAAAAMGPDIPPTDAIALGESGRFKRNIYIYIYIFICVS